MAVLMLKYSSTGCKHERKNGYIKEQVRLCTELLSSFSWTLALIHPKSQVDEMLR